MAIVSAQELEWTQVSEKLRIKYLLRDYMLGQGPADAGVANWPQGEAGTVHTHAGQDEIYIVLRGEGRVMYNGEEYFVAPGDMLHAKSGEPHAMVEGLSEGGVDVFFALLPVKEK